MITEASSHHIVTIPLQGDGLSLYSPNFHVCAKQYMNTVELHPALQLCDLHALSHCVHQTTGRQACHLCS